MTPPGLPHSEMTGSQPDCGSPVVSLLVCVLHRLGVPRHPPTAHHVLPGHGLLGGHGPCPRHVLARSSLARGTPSGRTIARTRSFKKRSCLATNNMHLVRYRFRRPCPLTCAACARATIVTCASWLGWTTQFPRPSRSGVRGVW